MSSIELTNLRIPSSDVTSLNIESGRIAAAGLKAERTIDLGDAIVFPGFIDVHNHGAVGIDVNEADSDGLIAIGEFLARNGVTAWMPTFVPDSDEIYRKVIREIEKVIAIQGSMPIAQIVGVHYEGVFANTQMCGALRPQYFRTFSGTELELLPKLESGAHMMTFAPETDGGVELAAELSRSGWIASIGHTNASARILDAALNAGARHITHFFNAMTGLHHRDVGVVGWGLTRDVSIDIIADGIHVHPDVLKLAIDRKGADSVSLISDSVAPTGLGDGEFELWGEKISVVERRTRNERGSIAGSVITMLDAVHTARTIGIPDQVISKLASLNPARLLGVGGERGSLEIGKRADLVAISDDGSVRFAMIGGAEVPI